MGPEWDFDLAFGGHNNDTTNQSDNMYIKIGYWHSYIFRDFDAAKSRVYYWRENIISVNGLVINKSNIP